jgi:hypothetical protein
MDINELRQAIRSMTRRSGLYKALKEELSALGYWRNKARGNPWKAKEASDRAKAIKNGNF